MITGTVIIDWTPDLLRKFKREYNKAVKTGAEQFTFDDHDFVTDYAKYLIEYLEGRFHAKS